MAPPCFPRAMRSRICLLGPPKIDLDKGFPFFLLTVNVNKSTPADHPVGVLGKSLLYTSGNEIDQRPGMGGVPDVLGARDCCRTHALVDLVSFKNMNINTLQSQMRVVSLLDRDGNDSPFWSFTHLAGIEGEDFMKNRLARIACAAVGRGYRDFFSVKIELVALHVERCQVCLHGSPLFHVCFLKAWAIFLRQ